MDELLIIDSQVFTHFLLIGFIFSLFLSSMIAVIGYTICSVLKIFETVVD